MKISWKIFFGDYIKLNLLSLEQKVYRHIYQETCFIKLNDWYVSKFTTEKQLETYFTQRENVLDLMEYLEQSKDLYLFIFSKIFLKYWIANVKRGADLTFFMLAQTKWKKKFAVRQQKEK